MAKAAGHPDFDPRRALAAALDVKPERLDPSLADPALVAAAWQRLDPGERAVTAALVDLGGAAPAEWIASEAAEELAGAITAEAVSDASAALEGLWERGFVARERGSSTHFLEPGLASALVAHARAWQEDLPGAPPPAPVCDDHVLACAFDAARHAPIRLKGDGTPFKRGVEELARRIGGLLPPAPAEPAAERVLDLLRALRLLLPHEGELAPDDDAALAWCRLQPAERATAVLARRFDGHGADALLLLRQLGARADRAVPEPLSLRMFRRAAARRSGFGRHSAAPGHFAALAADRHAEAVAALEDAGLAARTPAGLALTALGRAYPGSPGHAAPESVHVGGDLVVMVPRGLSLEVHLRIGEVARLESADVVARYRIDREMFLHALDHGRNAAEVCRFLEQHAAPSLPAQVRDDLRDWSSRFGEVTLHEGLVVACREPERHEEFAAVVAAAAGAQLIAPGVAVVAHDRHPALHRELVAAGFTPRRRPEGAARSRPSSPRGRGEALPEWSSLPGPDDPPGAGEGRVAAPPARLLVARLKEKYRKDLGSARLAELDGLDVDTLLELEERGRIRQFLEGTAPATTLPAAAAQLQDYQGRDLVPVTASRARQVLEQAVEAGRQAHLMYLVKPGGRRACVLVEPLQVTGDGAAGYVLARVVASGERKMLALERVLALRIPAAG